MRRPASADDRGESLIELLVAMLIMSTAVVAVVGGLGTAIMISDVHRKQADVARHLNAFAATIEGAVAAVPTQYDECPIVSYPSYTPGGGYNADPPEVRYWDVSTATFIASCPAGGDAGVQLVTLRVRSDDGRVDRSMDIIIRKPCRPTDTLCV